MKELFSNAEFWVAVAFFIFIGIILKFGYRRVVDGLDARAERIKNELDEARSLHEEAQALLASYQRKQRDALKEAEEIVEHAKGEAARAPAEAELELQERYSKHTETQKATNSQSPNQGQGRKRLVLGTQQALRGHRLSNQTK